jgi:hypothetical protein
MEYYSAIMKNEIILFAGKRMVLKIIMLHKISQTKKNKGTYSLSHVKSSSKKN